MVERGADVNAQNHRGETALHEAVKLKFNEMALWVVKHGADIHLENFRGYSPYDLALPWLQKELRDERDHFLKEQKKKVMAHVTEQQQAAQQQQQMLQQQQMMQQMGGQPGYDDEVSAGPGEAPPPYQVALLIFEHVRAAALTDMISAADDALARLACQRQPRRHGAVAEPHR